VAERLELKGWGRGRGCQGLVLGLQLGQPRAGEGEGQRAKYLQALQHYSPLCMGDEIRIGVARDATETVGDLCTGSG